jgi:hypothetical protein
MRRIVAIAAIAIGVGLLVVPVATHLWSRTDGAEVTFDTMRPLVSEEGIALAHENFGIVQAGGTQFLDEVKPATAKRFGVSATRLDAVLAEDYPAISKGGGAIPGYLQFVGPTIDSLDAGRDEFQAADDLPGLGLPITIVPWLFVGLGAGLLGAGALALVTSRRWPIVAILALGLGAVVVPLALGIPGKARDARDIGDVARPGLSQQGADTAGEIVVVLDGLVAETDTRLIPDYAKRVGQPEPVVRAALARDFPAFARFLAQWPSISKGPTGAALAAKQKAVVSDFADADETPVLELPWLVIVPGALLTLLAGAALARRREPVAARDHRAAATTA